MKRKDLAICVACSPGGHMIQAKRFEEAYRDYRHFFFTFRGAVAEDLRKTEVVYAIPNVVRQNPLSWLTGVLLSFVIACKTRPDVVLTTGAGVVVFFCVFAKLLGAKLVYIESVANIKRPTLTARILYPFADLFLVQWPGLLEYFPRAKYPGRLL